VYSFKEIVGYEVPDPYGQGLEKYRYVFQLLEVGMPAIKEKILTQKVLEKLKKKPKTAEKKPRKKSEKNSANA
jgi:hypothetical protein